MCKAWQDQYLSGQMEGIEQGRLKEICSCVKDGVYSIEVGASRAGMSVAEFEKSMEAAGYKIPELA